MNSAVSWSLVGLVFPYVEVESWSSEEIGEVGENARLLVCSVVQEGELGTESLMAGGEARAAKVGDPSGMLEDTISVSCMCPILA